MKQKLLAATLILVSLAIPIQVALGLIAAPPPGPIRIIGSDAVFVGRVTAIEPEDVEVGRIKYRIAVVQVNQAIKGLKNEKTIRVGFIPPVAPKPGVPITGGGFRGAKLDAGQEGLFMISKHPEGKFYQAPNFGYFIAQQDKAFDDEVKTAKKVVVILENPKAALQAKDAEERFLAASVAVSKYRTQRPPFPNKEEPIDAEESKLILTAIASSSKWGPARFGTVNAYTLFTQLGITAKDGWTPPKKLNAPDDIKEAVQAWIKANSDTYRIKRFVSQSDR